MSFVKLSTREVIQVSGKPTSLSEIITELNRPADINSNTQLLIRDLGHVDVLYENQIDKLNKALNLPSTYRVAKAAVKYFDGEFMGQEPSQLWDWAINKALAELNNKG